MTLTTRPRWILLRSCISATRTPLAKESAHWHSKAPRDGTSDHGSTGESPHRTRAVRTKRVRRTLGKSDLVENSSIQTLPLLCIPLPQPLCRHSRGPVIACQSCHLAGKRDYHGHVVSTSVRAAVHRTLLQALGPANS
jgi:hypothetical protein